MFYLIILALLVALVWVARRYALLRRGVGLLADALSQRRAFLHEDNALPELHTSWRQLVEESGNLIQEVTRLKQQRAGQLTQLETTLGNLQEGVLIIDRSNYVLLANAAVQTIFPAAKSILGQRIEVVLHSSEFLTLLDEVRAGRGPGLREIEFVEQGKTVWVEATGTQVPETSEHNGPWCLFVLHDVTRQKRLESVRKEFVANVSHELKTPISVIKGYAETLVEEHADMAVEDRTHFIRTIHRHADRLAAIVEDLLTLSRLESGVPTMRLVRQDLGHVLASFVEENDERVSSTGHGLKLSRPAEPITVGIDTLRIGQVLANLLDNALNYTPRGSRIEIGASRVPGEQMVEVWVEDNGPGIPANDIQRIFERFYRVEKGRARDTGGTGLGLSIVKHIVQLHGGTVRAESTQGKGTRISFRLPLGAAVGANASPVVGPVV